MSDQKWREKEKYGVIWREYPTYSSCSRGEGLAPFFFEGFKGEVRCGQTLINFGCGPARVAKDFIAKGLNVSLVDLSPYCLDEEIRHLLALLPHQLHFHQGCLWKLPETLKTATWIYCCDMLEHIPEKKIDTALAQMAVRMRRGGYFSICLWESSEEERSRHPAPLTMKGRDFWEEKLSAYFRIIGVDIMAGASYLNARVSARCPTP